MVNLNGALDAILRITQPGLTPKLASLRSDHFLCPYSDYLS